MKRFLNMRNVQAQCALSAWLAGSAVLFGGAIKAQAANVVFNYQASQDTGYGINTVGGHNTVVAGFTDGTGDGKKFTISALPFGQGANPNPVYEAGPANALIDYKNVLNTAFGANYKFNYNTAFLGTNEFNVQSYSVTAVNGGQIGEDIYVVYNPGNDGGKPPKSDPAGDKNLHWIQVIWNNWSSVGAGNTTGVVENVVDNLGAAVPYYDSSGGGKGAAGVTTIGGNSVFNFYDYPKRPSAELATYNFANGPIQWMAEDFLVSDTLTKVGGKEVENVYGGLEYGWQVTLPEPASLMSVGIGALLFLVRGRTRRPDLSNPH